MTSLPAILKQVRQCTLCEPHLSHGPRPVVQMEEGAQLLIVGQAPGIRVHNSGIPFDDPSGDRLRTWLGISKETFYNPQRVAIIPMGFCYPGTGKSGDFPPRPECAPAWREQLLGHLLQIKLTLAIGLYAQKWHLKGRMQGNLTETVRNWQAYWPEVLPLPHPSPRNNIWLKKNPWFEQELVPQLQQKIAHLKLNQ